MCQIFQFPKPHLKLPIYHPFHSPPIHPALLPTLLLSHLSSCVRFVHTQNMGICYFGANPAASNLFSLTLDITNNAQR